jgi:uncharacterized protein YbjT (DUF2867 family)
MKIAVVGGTGHIGAPLCRGLLAAGHQVRVLTRGGTRADDLASLGAELSIGSFETGKADEKFFEGADAAFTMIRSDWSNVDHYPEVAARLADALQRHRPNRVVLLSSFGADLDNAGHSTDFGLVEHMLGETLGHSLISLRAGWFMENFRSHTNAILASGVLTSGVRLDVPLPLVATSDITAAALQELTEPATRAAVREVQGPADLTMSEAANVIARELGRDVFAEFAPSSAEPPAAIRNSPRKRAAWRYRYDSNAAFNEFRVRFTTPRIAFDDASITFTTFVRDVWRLAEVDREQGSSLA